MGLPFKISCLALFISLVNLGIAQSELRVTPDEIKLKVGETAQIQAVVMDDNGEPLLHEKVYYYASKARIAEADSTGKVTANSPGKAMIFVIKPHPDGKYLRKNISVDVAFPPVAKVEFVDLPKVLYTDVPTTIETKVLDEMGFEREDVQVKFSTQNQKIASFDGFNNLIPYQKGKVKITAEADGIQSTQTIDVRINPVEAIEMSASLDNALTGDVIQLKVTTRNKAGKVIKNIPVSYSFRGKSDDVMEFATGMIQDDGRFVAYQSGTYIVTASCGKNAAHKTIVVSPRADVIKRDIDLVGRGSVSDKHTSDLWVWEGVDGRDYAVTGTWGADGEAFFWDVTDPANIYGIDTVKVDARTVNDVKVSADGRICVISREGASNRKNGIIILDVTDPRSVKLLAEFTEGLTGGVHNLFIYEDHVYALSNGERYDIINIEDPTHPVKVGSFELDTPGHSIHDVWVMDGIAYSSNWHDGVQVVDVGNGIAGGSPSNPVKISSYAYPSGWNHAAFPYKSKSTGKVYVIAGDEAFPYGLHIRDKPTKAAGWLHVIDFTDPNNPMEVAKYEVPGAGSHNFWIDGDILYVGNYNAGLRVVDLSGDLMGDLYKQGREIGWFIPTDSKGVIPNAPMTWGPQPHKGHIFFSDWNSGLWSVKLKEQKVTN